jgi:hypothetical protein
MNKWDKSCGEAVFVLLKVRVWNNPESALDRLKKKAPVLQLMLLDMIEKYYFFSFTGAFAAFAASWAVS